MENKILPLGSVVLLHNGTKKVMVIGYGMKTPENPDKIYDYCGCVFPEGVLRSDITCVFDKEQIQEIYFAGFQNEESNEFLQKVSSLVNQSKEPKIQVEALETEWENL